MAAEPMKTLLLLVPFLASAGCRNPAPGYVPVPPAPIPAVVPKAVRTPKALFPLDLGNEWTYTMRGESYKGDALQGKSEMTVDYRVTAVSPGGEVTLTLEKEGKAIDQQVWRSTPTGLYQVASGLDDRRYVPEQPLALLPLDAGRRFGWEGEGMTGNGSAGHSRVTSQILAPQNVDTGVGRLSAVPIVSRTDFVGGRVENSSWFRPGVGLVRLRQETSGKGDRREIFLLTLKTYAIKRT